MTSTEERGIPLDSLSFDLIVPRPEVTIQISKTSGKDSSSETQVWTYSPEEVKNFVDSLICCFLNFLTVQRNCQSYHTISGYLIAIVTLIEAQYYKLATEDELKTLPVMRKVMRHLKTQQSKKNEHEPVSNEKMKWLELPEVLTKIVEPLRQECETRREYGGLRSITAVAHSFAIFTLWGLLTFVAPRRQQEFRGMRIGLACELPRPEGLSTNQFIHPRPPDRKTNKEKKFGYLYKDVDGIWYRDMTVESYKTGGYKDHGHQENLKVPNPVFPDGRCFYDYLEAYLYGYYRDLQGNWVSGGQLFDTPKYPGAWYGLRMALNPTGDQRHLLVKPRTGEPYDPQRLTQVVRSHAHRLTGKLITPHFLREIYTTWFLDGGYETLLGSESEELSNLSHTKIVSALAYAMATSVDMLVKVYDRRRPDDKRKAVEKVMEAVVQKLIG